MPKALAKPKKQVVKNTSIEFKKNEFHPNTPTQEITASAWYKKQPVRVLINTNTDTHQDEIVGLVIKDAKYNHETLIDIVTKTTIGTIIKDETGKIIVHLDGEVLLHSTQNNFLLYDTITNNQLSLSKYKDKKCIVKRNTCIRFDATQHKPEEKEEISFWSFYARKKREKAITVRKNTCDKIKSSDVLGPDEEVEILSYWRFFTRQKKLNAASADDTLCRKNTSAQGEPAIAPKTTSFQKTHQDSISFFDTIDLPSNSVNQSNAKSVNSLNGTLTEGINNINGEVLCINPSMLHDLSFTIEDLSITSESEHKPSCSSPVLNSSTSPSSVGVSQESTSYDAIDCAESTKKNDWEHWIHFPPSP